MKPFTLSLCLAIASFCLASGFAASSPRPNILLIYSDDHGWSDLGAQGVNAEIRTPNLDQLARDGVRFARGYVTAPQCMPSRCGVITGRYQQRFGVEDNRKGPLPLEELTIAERLKPAGYLSGFVGKSHLDIGGDRDKRKEMRILLDHLPQHQGFDEYWRGELRQFYASHDLQGKPFPDAPHLVTDERFRVIVQTEAALSFLDRRATKPEQPWFLYLAWYAPHVPLDSPEPWFSQTPANLPPERRKALSMIACMDDGLGRIRAKLRDMGAEKNTLIFFIGDNGAPLGNAWNGSLNLPLIGQKGMLSEGGIRVPFLAAWPGTLPSGITYDQPVISLDVAATAVALAGLPHDAQLDGVDLMPFLSGKNQAAPHDTLYWRWGSQAAILEMPYKLVALGDRERMLFDVSQPDGENTARNLSQQQAEIAARLETKLKSWAATLQPPGMPTSLDAHHEGLFAEHDVIPKTASTPPVHRQKETEGSIQGWLCRNGTLAIKEGALVVTPEPGLAANARPFLACTGFDLAGPVTATLRLRAKQGGPSTLSWRTKAEGFGPAQTAGFAWPSGTDWQEVKVELGEKARIIHVRITPAKGASGVEIQSMVFRDSRGQTREFQFQP